MKSKLLGGVAVAAMLVNGQAWAQGSETEQVLITAGRPTSVGKLDAPLRDQPQNVTVVVRDTLDTLGVPRLEDLSYLTVGVQTTAPDRNVYNNGFFVRGFNNAPVITDGYYANSGPFGSYALQDLSTVESIEILRGPAALLYGQGNPGGIINLTTKAPLMAFGLSAEANFSDIGKRRLSADVTGPIGDSGIAFRMQGVVEDSDTFRDFVSNERILLAPAVSVAIGETVDLRFNYIYDNFRFTPDRGPAFIPELIHELPIDRNLAEPWLPKTRVIVQQLRAQADWHITEEWTARAGYFRYWNRNDGSSHEVYLSGLTPDTTLVERYYDLFRDPDQNKGTKDMITFQLFGHASTFGLRHTLSAAYDRITDESNYFIEEGVLPSIDYTNPVYSGGPAPEVFPAFEGANRSENDAFYIQDLIAIGERWKLMLGIRHDTIRQEGFFDAAYSIPSGEDTFSKTTPRVGVVFEPNPLLQLYGSYSTAFVPLSGTDFFGKTFEPEESRSFEIGARQQIGENLLLTGAIYDIEKDNILVADPVNIFFNINAGTARSQGAELELQGRLTPNWRVGAGVAYTDARITESADPFFPEGDRLPGASRWMLMLNSRYDVDTGLLQGLRLGGNIAYGDKRPYSIPNNGDSLDAYTRVDVFASYPLGRTELQLNVNNLFDERIQLANGYGLVQFDQPRTVFLTLRYRMGSLTQ
jgi:iron complex outermembrane recepter protein